ncbi:protease pro-enzyme activation domain-containing protein [Terrilactibacillus sp. S3-3]|nr:protease pro-enzyme activation domain-containing protein [Terrilactibacillus sp. S3-3]
MAKIHFFFCSIIRFACFFRHPFSRGASNIPNGRQPAAVAQGTGSAVLKKASFFSDMPDSKKISIDIVLKTRNQTLLQRFIQDSVNSASSAYHHYISVKTFKDTFGAAAGTVNEATSYLKKYGIHTSVYPDNLIITATGTVGQFDKAFSVDIQKTKLSGKTFQATKQEPTVPQYISKNVLAVLGLSDYSMFSSQSVKPPVKMHSQQSSGPLQQNPSDLVRRYHASSLNTAKGRAENYFSGGGGGFSVLFPTPDYQKAVSGVNTYTAVQEWQPNKTYTSVQRIKKKSKDRIRQADRQKCSRYRDGCRSIHRL